MTDTPEQPETVERRRPPKWSQFKKGQSGNPGGRPKGSKNTHDLVIENLEREISIRIDGQVTCTTAKDGILKAQVKRALDGDIKSAKFLFDLLNLAEERQYYLEHAADYLSKIISKATKMQPINEREAEKIIKIGLRVANNALSQQEVDKMAHALSSHNSDDTPK